MSSKFVIIVPSFNCEDYVEATLRSLLEQGEELTRVDRVILTDDCSTDRTIEIAKSVWSGPIPLEVYASEVNRGEYKNMNECIARLPSHIEWYLVMHADNLAKPNWLKTLVDAAEAATDRVGTIFTSWDDLNVDGSIKEGENREPFVQEVIEGSSESVATTLLRGCWWHISSCVTRVSTYREVGGLPQGLRLKGDWDFLMRLLGRGWDVVYLPKALMTYRMSPAGSSSVSFRRHRDVIETLTVTRRHHLALSAWQMTRFHFSMLKMLARRSAGSIVRGQWSRLASAFPVSLFTIGSLAKCLRDAWLGRRRFEWVSSSAPAAESRVDLLSARMADFYSLPVTRVGYQQMIDDVESSQPAMEGLLREKILEGTPKSVLEVGCGSGRIYERLKKEGLKGQYCGVEMAPEVIASNLARFPEAIWKVGSGYRLPADNNAFDVVFSYYVLEHCAFPERFLTSLLNAVAPGGKLLLVFPDFLESLRLGSQACGWDKESASAHLRSGRVLHALIRLWDSRIRMPYWLRNARTKIGPFPVNLEPRCLEPNVFIEPDVDAIYIASAQEIADWARSKGCSVSHPKADNHVFETNALVVISKPQ